MQPDDDLELSDYSHINSKAKLVIIATIVVGLCLLVVVIAILGNL